MADSEEIVCIESEEDLSKQQKKEMKELQAHVQKLKHGVPKGDKKKKKEANAEIEKLEAELKRKHENELTEFRSTKIPENKDEPVEELAEDAEKICLDDKLISDVDSSSSGKKKKSKAKRRKERKHDEEQAKQDRINACEEESLTSSRNIEAAALKAILEKRSLMIHEIPSDGNCLYSAVVDQLQRQGINSSIPSLRLQTAALMRLNPDEYRPFLTNIHSGVPLTDEQYEVYCNELESTPAWGGQVEIRALSTLLEQPIEVIQADGPCIRTGQEYDKQPLTLSYHRHIYGLGEHFNSVIPRVVREEHFTTVT